MRWTNALLVFVLVHSSSTAYNQITLRTKNASLQDVVTDIEKQTKYVFLYDPDEVKIPSITITIRNATLQQTLVKCFEGQPIEFTVVGSNVLLKRSSQQTPSTGPTIGIHGTVTDELGRPMQGVTVFNKHSNTGTQTDSGGTYTARGLKGDRLTFSFIGYAPREISISSQPNINVSLLVNRFNSDQVTVIGYGSSKMRDLTGSVSIVDVQDLGEAPYNTFDNALAGKTAGVDVVKTDGTPGGMTRVRIRGSSSLLGGNDPLYVIDGIPVEVRSNFIDPGFAVACPAADVAGVLRNVNGAALSASFVNGVNGLSAVNPADILSVSVLKDASSAAIYGSKAANGVVIVTTRTGKTNSPPQISLDYSTTVSSPYRTPKLLNASQYKILLKEAAQNASDEDAIQGYPPDPVSAAVLDSPLYFGTANTNWIKNVTRTAVSNNIGFSVSGGGASSKFFTSLAYNNTPGAVVGTDFRRISTKLNLETQIKSKIRITANLLLGYIDQEIGDGAYSQALFARPDWAPRNATGNYTSFKPQEIYFLDFLNPAALSTATNSAKTTSLLGSASGDYAILNNLRFRSTLSLNMQNYNQRNFLPGYIDVEGHNGNTPNPGGIGSNANSRFTAWFLENTLTYTKQLNHKNAANIVIGQSYETTKYGYFRATASGYPNNTTLTGLSSADSVISVVGDEPSSPQSYLLSFYVRANYSFLDKYLFTFTGRTDGSSKFGPNNKFGYFPSAAIAWRISREAFLKKVRWLSDLKLRGSYGLTGNQNIGDQIYRTLYSPTSYNGDVALIPTQLGNQGIKWESTKEADIGLDLSLLSGRLDATFDYYDRHTSDALFSLPVAASTSYASLLQNAISLRNRGFEISFDGEIIRGKDMNWTASINVTWIRSLVTRLNPLANLSQIVSRSGLESISANGIFANTALIQGKPLGLITGTYVTGIIKSQAQLKAYSNQMGTIAGSYDLQIGSLAYLLDSSTASRGYEFPATSSVIGTGSPKYFGGMSQQFNYKNFSLQCYFSFSHGGHLLWVQHTASDEFFGTANADQSMLNRYTPSNTNSHEPVVSLNYAQNNATNLDVFSSSYFKLRSVNVNYRLNLKKTYFSSAQVFVSATNVFTITKYPGSDPETSDDPYSPNGGYIDIGNYPATRTFSIGFKASF